ncbi:mas-related G-protein coupled receptor member D [Echinops telfairi]|uniref:Mas-related G-protein coupled receptor member D n=1 Tax=Echinops telfairi TaxID=9371 RepID=A0ABM0J362_ECHTE|nr:mas-related G-protein coupled receptor member D [Echinops telfairi]
MNSSNTSVLTPKGSRTDVWASDYAAINAVALLTCMCGMADNGWVIWLLVFRTHRNPFCVYVLNLAGADLLFLVTQSATIILEAIFQDKDVEAIEIVRKVKFSVYMVCMCLMTVISSQRCLSVLFPIWFRLHRPQHMSSTVCALLWGLSTLGGALASLSCKQLRHSNQPPCSTLKGAIRTLVLGVFTPLMMLSSLVLFVRIQISSRQWSRRPPRVLVVILVSVLVFLVFSVPYTTLWFMINHTELDNQVKALFVSIIRLLMSLSSSANPVVYILVGRWRSQRKRETLRAMLRRALQEDPEEMDNETPSTGTNAESESQLPTVPAQESPTLGISTAPARPCHGASGRLCTPPCWCHCSAVPTRPPTGRVLWASS